MGVRKRRRSPSLRTRVAERLGAMQRAWRTLRRVLRQRRQSRKPGTPVVWWMLTPSARMGNLGDQAQAVAMARWLRGQLGIDPIELDKDEYESLAGLLRWIIRSDDLILLQSGGNLGERGVLTERLRRRIIADFSTTPIISLPQTISFSDTPQGRAEGEISAGIYRGHPALDVVARDAVSLERGRDLFGAACHMIAPDPVLLMAEGPRDHERSGVLLVLRDDKERKLTNEQVRLVEASLDGRSVDRFDTKVDYPVRRGRREEVIRETLDVFARHDLVVTDRFHGMVFAYVTDTPCVVLENIDHKISSGFEWLSGCPSIYLASADESLVAAIEEVLAADHPAACGTVRERLDIAFAELEALIRSRSSVQPRS
jgi:exopolysaccharide biosynthesis predicted pyruvyltransferase EpsI